MTANNDLVDVFNISLSIHDLQRIIAGETITVENQYTDGKRKFHVQLSCNFTVIPILVETNNVKILDLVVPQESMMNE